MKLILTLMIPLFITQSYAASRHKLFKVPAENVGEKAYEVKVGATSFSMISHFDANGAAVEKEDGELFSMLDGELDMRYGLSTQLEILAGFRLRQNTSETSLADTTRSGIDSIYGGFRFTMIPVINKDIKYALEFKYRQTPYSNSTFVDSAAPTDDLILGDSGNEVTLGLHFTYDHTVNNYLYLYAAYNRPANDLSPEVLYRAESFYPYDDWAFSFGVKGVMSFNGDSYTGQSSDKPAQSTGATYLFNSINRSSTSPFATFEKAFDKWRMSFEISQPIAGTFTDRGFYMQFGITYRKEGITQERRKIEKFKEYVIEASILKSSPRGNFIKIDKGIAQDVEKGVKFDIFKSDYFGGNILVATGIVYEVGADWAIIKLKTRYRDMRIMPGFVARGY